jgi:NAD(P)-dependent dehydrogenase (short-subunit alcohol dehydrogenase family)
MAEAVRECRGRVALVTGASRGIGAAIAERLAAEGALVAMSARSLDEAPKDMPGTLREMVTKLEARGGRAIAIQGDVGDSESRERMVRECERQLGPIDILVNNAACGPYKPFVAFTESDFLRTYGVNVYGPLHLCQLVVPGMRERRRGWIVNISSATAMHPQGPPYIPWHRTGGYHLYGSSKSALDRITTGIAAEVCEDGVAVNTLAPLMAVITPGMARLDLSQFMDDSMIEPIEAMAEAALALSTCDPSKLTGRVTYSLPLLQELKRTVRTLDGREVYAPKEPAKP